MSFRLRRPCGTATHRAGFWRRCCWSRTRPSHPPRRFERSFLTERCRLHQLFAGCRDIGALLPEIVVDRAPQAGIKDVMRRISRRRHIAAGNLMLALSARLDARKLVLDGILDGLIVAKFEMQEWVVLDGSPMATKQGVAADEIDSARDPAAIAPGHHQKNAIAHPRANQ